MTGVDWRHPVVAPTEGVAGEKRARETLGRAADLYGVRAENVVAVGDDVATLVVEEARNHDLVILGQLRRFQVTGSLSQESTPSTKN